MMHWRIKRKLMVLAGIVALVAAFAASLPPYLQAVRQADTALLTGMSRVSDVWREERHAVAEQARILSSQPDLVRLTLRPPATDSLAPDRKDGELLVVIDKEGRAVVSLDPVEASVPGSPRVQGALNGHASSGLSVTDGKVLVLAAAPIFDKTKTITGAVVAGHRVGPDRLAGWELAAGGALTFYDGQPPAKKSPLLPASERVWQVADGPWVKLTVPLESFVPWLWPLATGLAAALLLLLWPVAAAPSRREEKPEGDEALAHIARQLEEVTALPQPSPFDMPDAVFLLDAEGRIVASNGPAKTLAGMGESVLHGRAFEELVPDVPPLRAALHQHLSAVQNGADELFETRLSRPGSGPVQVEVAAGTVPHADGPRAQLVVRDITRRNQAAEHRAEADKMAGIGALAGGIAHDYNNALGGILGYAALIKDRVPEDDKVYHYTDIIERSAARASELTRQLLGYARGGKYHSGRVRVGDIVQQIVGAMEKDYAERNITVEARTDTHLAAVEGDGAQLYEVLANLCANARDAMPHGGQLHLTCDMAEIAENDPMAPPGLPPGKFVRLSVSDTGHGMTPETRKKMFEPFFTTRTPGENTGLGLAMVWGIIQRHGGQITVASSPGHGTTVRLYLPALEGSMAVLDEFLPPKIPQGVETVLVIDDEPAELEAAREILARAGYGVVQALSGQEALDVYREYGESIALVLLDIVMPKMSGRETLVGLKQIDPDVKVVVASGFSRHGQAHDLLEAGAAAYIHKPYRTDELAATVRTTLDGPPKTMEQSA